MFPWQVFGLCRLIPTRQTSQAQAQCHLAFVPAYRCGAVPDFHRIPFSLSIAGETVEAPTISGRARLCNATCCG
jgi:hypothetical protein